VIIWVVEGTWPACVDAANTFAPPGAEIVLLHVTGEEPLAAAHGAYAGLLGRGHPGRDPGKHMEEVAASSATRLLQAAADRLARPCTQRERSGRAEREVTSAAQGAGLLIVARDGDLSHLGPRSLGKAGRFVVDHAPCPVLLVWPGKAPDFTAGPPGPPRPPDRGPHRPPDHGPRG
jgi:nucleotide-binding universal stress UspA family protein